MTPKTLVVLLAVSLIPPASAQHAKLITTFTNPYPATGDQFGIAVAALGHDRVLIGAHQDGTGTSLAGAAYLFKTNGTLLATFTSPSPTPVSWFGWAVATVGDNGILIGAYRAPTGNSFGGMAYLFSTNGALMTTFTNPTPTTHDAFGYTVSAFGNDRVIIGAHFDYAGAPSAGSAYLYNTNGTLLTTFINPSPTTNGYFGNSLAAVGNDRVFIGATGHNQLAGAAYLFSTNGMLLTTILNPTPSPVESFGRTVAITGSDLMLIGAYNDNGYTGAAHLFSTNGQLVRTFVSPVPEPGDRFSYSVEAIGNELLLIGADLDSSAAESAGAVYLLTTNGVVLNTYFSPTPKKHDGFGRSLTKVGSNHVLVGANFDDTGATDAGAAYLFELPPPTLMVAPVSGSAEVSWAPDTSGFILQSTSHLSPANWTNAPSGEANPAQVPLDSPAQHFRLIKP